MTMPGYQCQKCRRTFTVYPGCSLPQNGDLLCPTCGSGDVNMIELQEEWGYSLQGKPCFG